MPGLNRDRRLERKITVSITYTRKYRKCNEIIEIGFYIKSCPVFIIQFSSDELLVCFISTHINNKCSLRYWGCYQK